MYLLSAYKKIVHAKSGTYVVSPCPSAFLYAG